MLWILVRNRFEFEWPNVKYTRVYTYFISRFMVTCLGLSSLSDGLSSSLMAAWKQTIWKPQRLSVCSRWLCSGGADIAECWQQFPLTVVENMCHLHYFFYCCFCCCFVNIFYAFNSAALDRTSLALTINISAKRNEEKEWERERDREIVWQLSSVIVAAFSSWLLGPVLL